MSLGVNSGGPLDYEAPHTVITEAAWSAVSAL